MGCGVTKLVRAVVTVLIACCLLRLQEAQLYKSAFLSVVEVSIDLAWKNLPPLPSSHGDKDWTVQPLAQALFCASSADDHPPIARTGMDMRVQPGEPVMLRGTDSTDDRGIVSYEWKQVLGDPSVEMKVGAAGSKQLAQCHLWSALHWALAATDLEITLIVLPSLSQSTHEPVSNSCGALLMIAPTLLHTTGMWHFLASSGLRIPTPGRHLKPSWVLPGWEHPTMTAAASAQELPLLSSSCSSVKGLSAVLVCSTLVLLLLWLSIIPSQALVLFSWGFSWTLPLFRA